MSKPFVIGQTYLTARGEGVIIIASTDNLPGYESVKGSDGLWRYNRTRDRGRVVGSAYDMSDPNNLIPEE